MYPTLFSYYPFLFHYIPLYFGGKHFQNLNPFLYSNKSHVFSRGLSLIAISRRIMWDMFQLGISRGIIWDMFQLGISRRITMRILKENY
jgi:hypothetical protein